MKKLLLLLLIAPMIGNAQNNEMYSINLNGLNFIGMELFPTYRHNDTTSEITVPDNEYWILLNKYSTVAIYVPGITDDFGGYFVFSSNSFTGDDFFHYSPYNMLGEGWRFYFNDDDQDWNDEFEKPTIDSCSECVVKVLKFETTKFQNSLSYNEPETIKNNSNTPILFPNPTSSLLALNSDKEYDIEVYDMSGNKLMAITGNSVNMAHLSTATYIVKATDKSNNEELTYKVVKN